MRSSIPLLMLIFVLVQPCVAGSDIPVRPEKLSFPALHFDAPQASELRFDLDNGVPGFIAVDRLLPLVTLRVYFRGGRYLEPTGREGLADLTGSVWRTGGAGDLDAKSLDEELDFLAANLSTGIGGTFGNVTLNLLSKDVDRGIELLMDVILRPRFEQSRLDKAKEDLLAGMKRRNDSTRAIESREWSRLIYGDNYWLNRLPTQSSVDSISREDLISFHKKLIEAGDMVIAVAGDFDRDAMISKLNHTLGQLSRDDNLLPPVPQPEHQTEPAIYLINKPDVNQGRVSLGHLGPKQPFDHEFEMRVANDILGGGGFTSWILSRVRSDEGLAYSAGSAYSIGTTYPGTFRAFFQSKSATCARAIQLILSLVGKLQHEGVNAEEIATSKNSFIETFPNRFGSAQQTVSVFATDELIHRPSGYWQSYRERVKSVSEDDVRMSASRYLAPDKFIILIVGNLEEILKGSSDYPGAQLEKMGKLVRVPLRDPMTLEPLQ